MRSTVLSSLLLSLLLCAIPAQASDKDFDAFWQTFKQALQQNDQKKLASLTKTPLLYQQTNLDKVQLLAKIGSIFTPKVRKCLLTQHLKGDSEHGYSGFCGQLIYTFSKVNGHYLFTDLDAND